MGIIFKISSKRHSLHRERQNVEDRTEKPELQNSFKTIEQKNNLLFRNEEIHDNVIGMYIERYYFKTSGFSKAT